jgi:hypothetical protein
MSNVSSLPPGKESVDALRESIRKIMADRGSLAAFMAMIVRSIKDQASPDIAPELLKSRIRVARVTFDALVIEVRTELNEEKGKK